MQVEEFIHKMPKAELSVHLEGCLEPDLMLELAKRNAISLPYSSPTEIRQAYHFKDLPEFLKIYYAGVQVLITEQDFYDLTFLYLKKAASQTIRHAEIFFDPQAHLARGIAFETIIAGMQKAIEVGQKQFGISAYPIMCFMRDLGEEKAEEVFQLALPFKEFIVAVGLDSNAQGHPPKQFKDVFIKARDHGFLTVAIAGEGDGVDTIWQALDVLKVSRIDHGISCMQDTDLVARLAATQIPINVCPISNVRLGYFPTMRQHPLKRMYEAGLCVTINSDDPAYFSGFINENFIQANAALKLSKAIMYEFAKNSFNASFLDYETKQKLIKELEKFYLSASK